MDVTVQDEIDAELAEQRKDVPRTRNHVALAHLPARNREQSVVQREHAERIRRLAQPPSCAGQALTGELGRRRHAHRSDSSAGERRFRGAEPTHPAVVGIRIGLGILFQPQRERRLEPIALHDAGSVGRGDDAGEPSAGAELQDASPREIGCSPSNTRINVVLPDPFGPISPTTSPRISVAVKSSISTLLPASTPTRSAATRSRPR